MPLSDDASSLKCQFIALSSQYFWKVELIPESPRNHCLMKFIQKPKRSLKEASHYNNSKQIISKHVFSFCCVNTRLSPT